LKKQRTVDKEIIYEKALESIKTGFSSFTSLNDDLGNSLNSKKLTCKYCTTIFVNFYWYDWKERKI